MADDREVDAREEILGQVYDELRSLASHHLRRERVDHTLQPTALVHEAWLRLSRVENFQGKDKADFLVAASGAIRRILVDHARSRARLKRGGGDACRVTLTGLVASDTGSDLDVLALHEALERLAELSPRKARVVELRYFGGLTTGETAAALAVGTSTVEEDWVFARSWLGRVLGPGNRDDG